MMYDFYLAGPLFNPLERKRNEAFTFLLEEKGYKVFLPQRDGGELSHDKHPEDVYWDDIRGLEQSKAIIALLDGAHVDEGTAFEVGFMTAKGRDVYAIYNDDRSFSKTQQLNNMFHRAMVVKTLDDLFDYWGVNK